MDSNNKLTVLEKNLPLRAYPEQDLNTALVMDFLPWICGLLSLTDEVSAERLELALPALKEQCIGMGFPEIKKMFEMYADGNMSVKPMTNFFDRVLLGKIVSEYKTISNMKKRIKAEGVPMTDAEVERVMLDAVDRVKKEIKETGDLVGTAHHVYDFLTESGRLNFSPEEKNTAMSIAKRELLSDAKKQADGDYQLHKKLDKTLSKIHKGANARHKSMAKTILIINYFKNNLKTKNYEKTKTEQSE